ncbi:protein of unknown function [Micropruina glycogenica]|uniref:Uncharacterized protein n=1 Tax=Micropruina glycogenica TaxID=75385 RepID=A0A2N9JF23_9ACTN|nr:protein of unknown function [Micropruina glycogenica]
MLGWRPAVGMLVTNVVHFWSPGQPLTRQERVFVKIPLGRRSASRGHRGLPHMARRHGSADGRRRHA